MKVLSLEHEHYRNLRADKFFPGDGVNVVCGQNAQGKTNLLEALWLFTGAHSFRGAKEAEMVAFAEGETPPESAWLELRFLSGGREQTARITLRGGRRQLLLNGVAQRSCGALAGVFCAVIFSPEHLSLVKAGPLHRRNFLDSAICQMRPAYVKIVNQYTRILLQRNALLRDIVRHRELLDTIDIWDERLARFGAQMICERLRAAALLAPRAAEVYGGIAGGKETLTLAYRSTLEEARDGADEAAIREGLLRLLHAHMDDDVRMGATGWGPHRDDLELCVGGASARAFASQGQQRSAVLALKLAEASVLSESCGEEPVILLDDVLSELDSGRQDYLLNHLDGRQVFLTCCSAELTGTRGDVFVMERGRLRPQI